VNIGVLGTGNMATALGGTWARAGHSVLFGSRDPERGRELAAKVGCGSTGGSYEDAAAFGEVVLLAVPYHVAPAVLTAAGDLAGKTLVDITSAWDTSVRPIQMAVGLTTSAAEELARLAPDAKVVKAFCHVFAEVILEPSFAGVKADAYYCGDDEEAKGRVAALARDAGLEPLDAGPLSSARQLEPLGLLWMKLARFSGSGPQTAFKLLRR